MRTRAFLNEVKSCFLNGLSYIFIYRSYFVPNLCLFFFKEGCLFSWRNQIKYHGFRHYIPHLSAHFMCVHLMYTCAVLSERKQQSSTSYPILDGVKQSAYMIQNMQMKISFASCRGAYSSNITLYVVAYWLFVREFKTSCSDTAREIQRSNVIRRRFTFEYATLLMHTFDLWSLSIDVTIRAF